MSWGLAIRAAGRWLLTNRKRPLSFQPSTENHAGPLKNEAGAVAMGVQRADVLWMVLGRGLRLTALGIAIGLVLSAASTRMLRSLLYGLSQLDPVAFAAAALGWTAAAMLASYLPARRATRVDPVDRKSTRLNSSHRCIS